MIVIGVDIGMSGAIAGVDHRGTFSIADLPVVEDDAGKRLDGRKLLDLVRGMVPIGEKGMLVFEDVRVQAFAGRQMSHKTESALSQARGAVQAIGDVAGLPLVAVQPKTWKKRFDLGGKEDKGKAREAAVKLYPTAEPQLKRVKDHNRAEALLIAHWALRVHS